MKNSIVTKISLKVYILTEGGHTVGYGHLMRCQAIAQGFLEKGIKSVFYIRGNPDINGILEGFSCIYIDWFVEPVDVKDKIVIVDSYNTDQNYCKYVYENAIIVVFIDDYNRIPYPGGFVLNSVIGAEEIDYPENPDVTYLLGPEYHPLRREFWNVPEKVIRESIEKVLITFGGSDISNETPRVLKELKEKCPYFERHVIVGKGFLNIDDIKATADEKTVLIFQPDAERMKQEMLSCDIAISAAGQTIAELARVGVPAISITVAKNQINNAIRWNKLKFLEHAGNCYELDLYTKLINTINKLKKIKIRKEKSKIGRTVIDGEGTNRIVKKILNKYLNEAIIVRPVKRSDMKNLLRLANEPYVRNNSFNSKPITLIDHEKWFNNIIDDPNVFFLVAENNKELIGQIRFDIKDKESIISISIFQDYTGLGIGEMMFQKGIKALIKHDPNILVILANIKIQNERSIKFFEKINFKFNKEIIISNSDAVQYTYRIS